ncbi:MAG: hypothetical protein KIT83_18980, partial [Bryobacterales bacterium]|nr:hypothetical protein [Bryobacterales bacterium]
RLNGEDRIKAGVSLHVLIMRVPLSDRPSTAAALKVFLTLNGNLAAHQAREEEVARGFEVSILKAEIAKLPRYRGDGLLKIVHQV